MKSNDRGWMNGWRPVLLKQVEHFVREYIQDLKAIQPFL